MLRLALAQMRRSVGRLTAAAVAIVIGTAFLAATLLAGDVFTRTAYDAVMSTAAQADFVVDAESAGGLSPADLEAIRAVPEVDAVHGGVTTYTVLTGPAGNAWLRVTNPATDPRLEATTLVDGRHPQGAAEIAVPDDVAERLGIELDGTVVNELSVSHVDDDGAETVETLTTDLTVVGLLDGSASAFLGTGGTALATVEQVRAWVDADEYASPDAPTALVAQRAGAGVESARESITAALRSPDGITVRTKDEQAARMIEQITGQAQQLTSIVVAFAAVALFVTALVIANTFQVLVAQRTRTLALLRCVGATRSQLRRSVIAEALILGTVASVAGIALGAGVIQVALLVLSANGTDVPLPSTVTMTTVSALVPLLAGVAVTVAASLAPARAATRVSPLAALQPTAATNLGARGGRARAWLSGLLAVAGTIGLGLGAVVATTVDPMLGLALGILSGAVSFVGVILGAVFWVPPLIGVSGRLLARRGGAAARLAAANSVRNPRRTSATSVALLIGVTLVAMMATGAASARTSLTGTLDAQFAVDMTVGSGGSDEGIPEGLAEQIAAIDGVEGTTPVRQAEVEIVSVDGAPPVESVVYPQGLDVEAATPLVRDPESLAGLTDGVLLVPPAPTWWYGLEDARTVTVKAAGAADDTAITLDVVRTELGHDSLLLTDTTLDRLGADATPVALWVRLEGVGDDEGVIADVSSAAAETQTGLYTAGAAMERVFYQQVVDTLLAIVVGLLAVAVVIALIGVANTLSLSVLERRRESATLRAIGLSRPQLRGSLAVEGALIALVGAVVGSVLGTLYGWIGARTVLGEIGPVTLTVPWGHLGLVVGVAVLAGLLASVLPARSAARTSPVEALAVG